MFACMLYTVFLLGIAQIIMQRNKIDLSHPLIHYYPVVPPPPPRKLKPAKPSPPY